MPNCVEMLDETEKYRALTGYDSRGLHIVDVLMLAVSKIELTLDQNNAVIDYLDEKIGYEKTFCHEYHLFEAMEHLKKLEKYLLKIKCN
ncbi:hypothetical protein D8T47_13760 [Vibrio vulnificus]|nr:hypothetical protein D8T47_13760 [Vibrio vulnificus]